MKLRTPLVTSMLLAMVVGAAWAKLPTPPLTDEQKAAAELAKAKAAHQAKVDAYQTCMAAQRAADHYFKTHPQATRPSNAPACTDPGPFAAPGAAPAPAAAGAPKKS